MNDGEMVGLVGLGLMGSALAERLLGAGRRVLGCDVDDARVRALEQAGGQAADDPEQVASECRRILLSLPTTDVVELVLGQMGERLREGQVIVDTTTGEPTRTTALGAQLAERGVAYLDATVSGSSEQARRGEVVVMAGGKAETFDACRDLFDCFACKTFHVGPCGSGSKMKLVTNLVLGLNRAAGAEGLAFAEAIGLDPTAALGVILNSMAGSRIMETKGRKMVERDFAPQAKLSQHLKDVRLILGAASSSGLELPLSQAHRGLLEAAEAAGYGDADNSAVIQAYADAGADGP